MHYYKETDSILYSTDNLRAIFFACPDKNNNNKPIYIAPFAIRFRDLLCHFSTLTTWKDILITELDIDLVILLSLAFGVNPIWPFHTLFHPHIFS